MSKIPKAPSLAKPKTIFKNDAATQAHAALLALIWNKLDVLVAELFSVHKEAQVELENKAVVEYRKSMSKNANELLQKSCNYPDERKALLEKLASKIQSIAESSPPKIDPEVYKSKIINRVIEEEIYDLKDVNKVVGFVDIACQISITNSLSLESKLPTFASAYFELYSELGNASEHNESQFLLPINEIKQAVITTPHWSNFNKNYYLWFDIRTNEVAVGQLIRELKTLRDYGAGVTVVLVMEQVDRELKTMLKHEGFFVLSKAWLEQLK